MWSGLRHASHVIISSSSSPHGIEHSAQTHTCSPKGCDFFAFFDGGGRGCLMEEAADLLGKSPIGRKIVVYWAEGAGYWIELVA